MLKITKSQQKKINQIGKKYNLKLILIYGSYAKNRVRPGSDLDIAVLGKKLIEFEKLLEIHSGLAGIFGDSKRRELDVKSLHNVDPFFRYQVMKDGVLIYGNFHEYIAFKVYAYRDYQENIKIRKLKDLLIEKRQKHLEEMYVG